MSITRSPTFCPAPWTSINIDQTGQVNPCMHCFDGVGNIKQNTVQEIIQGSVLRDVKSAMVRGDWHHYCRLCQQSEESTGHSARTMRKASADTLSKIDQDINWFEPQHIVVNWSNLCNLSCTYCNPETSTVWQAVKKIPINHIKNEHESLIALVKEQGHKVQGLTLGGGEPLLQKGLVEFLSYLDPNNVRVLITTNLSVDLANNPVYQTLKNWPTVDWQVSFDNVTKEKFEYVRDRANWQQFVDNIDLMKQAGHRVIAHPAYSIYCAFDLVEYYEFCTARDLDIFWCELDHPWHLDTKRLTESLRNQAIDEIDRVVDRWGTSDVLIFRLAIDTLQRYRSKLKVTNSLNGFENYYKTDPIAYSRRVEAELKKTTTFEQLWPELTALLKEKHYGKY